MATRNPSILNKSSLDVVIYLSSSLSNQPIALHQGVSEDAIFHVNVPDNVTVEPTATGDISIAQMPILVDGEIHQHASSPNIEALSQLNKAYLNGNAGVSGFIPATISVKSPSGGENLLYSNVFITNPFGGYNYDKEKGKYVFKFKATIPDINQFSNVVNGLGNLINVL